MNVLLNRPLILRLISVNCSFHKKENKNHGLHQLEQVNFIHDKDLLKALDPQHNHDKWGLLELHLQFYSH